MATIKRRRRRNADRAFGSKNWIPGWTLKKKKEEKNIVLYSTVGCQRTGGRIRPQPGSFLIFKTPANFVLLFGFVFESRGEACSAYTGNSILISHTQGRHAGLGKRLKCFNPSNWSCLKASNVNFPARGRSYLGRHMRKRGLWHFFCEFEVFRSFESYVIGEHRIENRLEKFHPSTKLWLFSSSPVTQ